MSDEIDKEKQFLVDLVNRCADQMREHCDSVRIFVTKNADDGSTNTISYEIGRGNFYAQVGQVSEWLLTQQEYQKLWAKRKDAEEQEE